MRILQVTEASGSGTLRVVELLCNGLVQAGHDVTLAYGRRPETPAEVGGSSATLRRVPLQWERRSPASQVRAARELRRLVADVRPDLVHLHSTFAGVVGGIALRRSPLLVYTPHAWASSRVAPFGPRLLSTAADRFIVHRAHVVGAVGESEAAAARRLGARRIQVVPNGIPELDLPVSPRGAPTRRRVIAGGRIVRQRRPAETARVLCAVRDLAEVGWVGGGAPADVEPVQALGVEITGWLPHDRAMLELEASSVYLHWTAWDGQSIAVLEAIARDVVVVASDIPPNRELLAPEQLGRTEDEAIALVRRVLQDPVTRRRLLAAQRIRGASHGAAAMVQGWIDVYRRAIAGGTSVAEG